MAFLNTEFALTQNLYIAGRMADNAAVYCCVLGSGTASYEDREFSMQKGDLFAVFPGDRFSLDLRGGAAAAAAICPAGIFQEIGQVSGTELFCNSVLDTAHSYKPVRDILDRLTEIRIHETEPSDVQTAALILTLFDIVCRTYRNEGKNNTDGSVRKNDADREIVRKVVNYVELNYKDKINLHELADDMFISVSSLSRLFLKQSGMLFSDYVRKVRLEKAAGHLLSGTDSVSKVSIDSGFGSPASFTRAFEAYYGISPASYRMKKSRSKKTAESSAPVPASDGTDRGKQDEGLMDRLREAYAADRGDAGKVLNIHADIRYGQGYKKTWNQAINIGPARGLAMSGLQNHIRILHEELSFRYVRIWNIFSKKLMLTDGMAIGQYNYLMLDEVLDFLVSEHIRPFLDFGVRPDAALANPGNYIFIENENIEFASREVWEAMLRDFLRHIVTRYGREEVSGWIFEFSSGFGVGNTQYYNDPDYSFTGTFLSACRIVREILPDAMFGGPMMSFNRAGYDELESFISELRQNGCTPDFLSFIMIPQVFGREDLTDRQKQDFEAGLIGRIRQLMVKNGFDGCRLFISEWNSTISSRDYLNDSTFRAAYFVDRIQQIWNMADMLVPWIGTDIVSNYYDSDRLANGGNGFLAKNGIKKPVFYAFEFMNMMGEYILARGEGYLITRSASGGIYCLLYTYRNPSPAYDRMGAHVSSPEMIESLFTEKEETCDFRITVGGLVKDGRYIVKSRLISDSEGTILSEWARFGYEQRLTGDEVSYIRNACYPRIRMERYAARDGRIVLEVSLKKLEIVLLHIHRDVEDVYGSHI
ncbi:MAG: helix-turn-helix domain-containing protein [Lachnospiraceae bacterium]|nr:helix-turn-helix domain-containing protein [Lachnospiraceae bacterium]